MKIKIVLIIAACVAMFCIHGFAMDSKENNVEAIIANAKNGDPKAQNDLGLDYALGSGVQEDPAEADNWFRKSAEQGYPPAQVNLGYRAWKGAGMKRDLIEAAKWLKLASLAGKDGAAETLAEVISEMTQDQKVEAGVDRLKFLPKKMEFAAVSDRQLLKGLGGIRVEINLQGTETNSLTKERLKTSVELHMRSAGIKIQSESGPLFTMDVLSIHNEKIHLTSYRMRGSLEAEGRVKYENVWVSGAKIWDYETISLVGDNNSEQGLIEDSQMVVEKFANEYLAANPKN